MLEKYLVGEERKELEKLRGTFIKMWALGKEDDSLIQKAIESPAEFVLKANREGGKGNYFDDQLVEKMQELLENPNMRSGYILQKRILSFYISVSFTVTWLIWSDFINLYIIRFLISLAIDWDIDFENPNNGLKVIQKCGIIQISRHVLVFWP